MYSGPYDNIYLAIDLRNNLIQEREDAKSAEDYNEATDRYHTQEDVEAWYKFDQIISAAITALTAYIGDTPQPEPQTNAEAESHHPDTADPPTA